MTRSGPNSSGPDLSRQIPDLSREIPDFSRAIKDVRNRVAALRTALLSPAPSPDQIIGCVPELTKAASGLTAIERRSPAHPAVSIRDLRELSSLKTELRAAAKLIEHGAAFHRGWARLLGAAVAGYTPSGEAAPLITRGSLAMEG